MKKRKLRVLVADDDHDLVLSLTTLLRAEGHDAFGVHHGGDVVETVAEYAPDALLLDIGLPKMSGYELAAALRADPRTRSIALVALTGYGRAPDRRKAFEAGFDEHLVKPVELDALLTTLNRLLAATAAGTSG
jgi:CheY-like chemotaxis protein